MIAKVQAERVPLGNQNLLPLDPKLLLRLSQDRKIRNLTE
jgi:hypothetical protein